MSDAVQNMPRMEGDEFLRWQGEQAEGGRYEPLDGRVFVKRRPASMRGEPPSLAAERAIHVRAKRAIAARLEAAVNDLCEAYREGRVAPAPMAPTP